MRSLAPRYPRGALARLLKVLGLPRPVSDTLFMCAQVVMAESLKNTGRVPRLH